MKHLKKFNEEIGDPSVIGMSDPDDHGFRHPIRRQSNDDEMYKNSDDFEMIQDFVKELNLNVTEDQIVKFLKDLSN
jgi:hypothetical protein